MIYLDTHVVAWMYQGITSHFPPAVAARLRRDVLVISPMVELELQYLHEIGRLKPTGATVIRDLAGRSGLRVSDTSFAAVVAAASQQDWTRDPFDRVIAGQAVADGKPLLTRDETILKHCKLATWT